MKKTLFTFALSAACAFSATAQTLQPATWQAYGVSFKAPAGYTVEDDSEEGYILSTPVYYITVQLLEGEGIQRSELAQELKNIATDDEVTAQSDITSFELPQFYGVWLRGDCESDQCLYSYLLTKEDGSGLYVSIVYTDPADATPETILKSFTIEE